MEKWYYFPIQTTQKFKMKPPALDFAWMRIGLRRRGSSELQHAVEWDSFEAAVVRLADRETQREDAWLYYE